MTLGFAALSSEPIGAIPIFPPTLEVPPIVVTLPGGGYYAPWPEPIVGHGYGVLLPLQGEAHGVVIAAGNGAAMLRNPAGEAAGAVGVGGWGKASLTIKAAASGACGVQGRAVGAIALKGSAVGRQDDDDEAIAWLLAA